MGDRGSISVHLLNGGDSHSYRDSVTLFRHWGGSWGEMLDLVERAWKYVKPGYGAYLNRTESEIIALLTRLAVETDNYSAYLGKDENDGDNSDNGHYVLQIDGDNICGCTGDSKYKWTLFNPDGITIKEFIYGKL